MILCPGNEQGFLPPEYFERVVQIRPSKYSSILFTIMYILMQDCKGFVIVLVNLVLIAILACIIFSDMKCPGDPKL